MYVFFTYICVDLVKTHHIKPRYDKSLIIQEATDFVRMLTSSCVLPCCSLSHCSSRAVSSALESTLADADAITSVKMHRL